MRASEAVPLAINNALIIERDAVKLSPREGI